MRYGAFSRCDLLSCSFSPFVASTVAFGATRPLGSTLPAQLLHGWLRSCGRRVLERIFQSGVAPFSTAADTGYTSCVTMARHARVLYNYQAAHEDELTIRFNQIVTVVNENSGAEGWWEVKRKGKTGKIPSNYIEEIPKPSGPVATALYDHVLEEVTGQYLPFNKGDTIIVLEQDPDGWWLGYLDEEQGLFPKDYIQMQPEKSAAPEPAAATAAQSKVPARPGRPQSTATTCVEGDPMAEDTDDMTASSTDAVTDSALTEVEDEDESALAPYEKLGQVLHNGDMSVVECMCSILDPASSENMAKTLVPIFEREGKIMDLIQAVIDLEIKRTTKTSTLFRTNSMASQIMRCYARLCGKQYVSDMLKPLITELNEFSGSIEIDPRKITADSEHKDVQENLTNFKYFAAKFVKQIVDSLKTIPGAFRFVSSALVEGVEFKFPEATRVVIAGFFFLRFVCPAVVSPEGYDIVPKGYLNANGRRGLLLISKVVQNLANGVEFGNKEEFMKCMNDFVVAHFDDINYILDELPNIPEDQDVAPLPRAPVAEIVALYKKLHEGVSNNLEKIKKQYEETDSEMDTFQELALAVRLLGPTDAQLKKMEMKNKELMEDEDEKSKKKRAEEKKKKEEEKKKAKEEKKKKEEEKKTSKKEKKKPKTEKERRQEEQLALITPPEGSKVMCEGYLSKMVTGTIGKKWKKQYFVLFSGQPRIHFYKSQSDVPNILGFFCLLPSFFVQNLPKAKHSGGHQFCVRTPSAEYQLMAHTEGELRMWLTTLNRHVNTISNPKTAEDKAVLIAALQHKIIDQEEELDQVKQAYQVAKDEDTRTKLRVRAEELQASITALRQAHNKQKGLAPAASEDPQPSPRGGGAATSSSAADGPPPVDRGNAPPPVDRVNAPSHVPSARTQPARAQQAAGRAQASAGRAQQVGMAGAGRAANMGMGYPGYQQAQMMPGQMGAQMGAQMGGQMRLPPGMTMQQYQQQQQLRQQQLYQQQLYQQQMYQQKMRQQQQGPYGGGWG
eukprot:TRINITY_DN894_c0_g1_i1.p1 TRINITY_DN894_c0_g1~~TRINITY_DN894_c0_g1_i1.p1  ORF type:complete len:1012 (+),score=384.73 TRINITY_DN894_c0_g1_i1:52-3087(+)